MKPSIIFLITYLFISSCNPTTMEINEFDWQGHRGCRGLLPENTIPAFLKALNLQVNTLEMDVAVSKDHQIIVSHEPWMSGNICLTPDSERINEEEKYKIYEMDYSLISTFDCGSLGNHRFPKQEKMLTHKPSLVSVFEACEQYISQKNFDLVKYNIEIKSKPEWDNIYTPTPDIFSDLLVNEIKSSNINIERFVLQSFDIRILQYIHQKHPEFILALLIEKPYEDTAELVNQLGFKPQILSPYYKLLNQNNIEIAHQMGMKVIPWTVNETFEMQQLIEWGVDGIITDYPDIPHNQYKK